jgi:hypothetical protein
MQQVAEAAEVLHRNMVLPVGQFTFHRFNKRIRINCFYFLNFPHGTSFQNLRVSLPKSYIKKFGDGLLVRTQSIVKHITV